MLIRVHIRKDNLPAAPYRTGHKPLALVYSLALHAGVVALLFLPGSLGSESDPYHSVVVQLEKDHKLIYYDFHKELPKVSASNAQGKRTTPSPNAPRSKQRIVAAPNEKPGKQLVYLPEPHIQLKKDLTAPNLIAIETPVPDRPKPKPFQAPETPKITLPPTAPLPNAPGLAASASSKDPALSALLNKPSEPVRAFVAPPAKTVTPAAPAALPNAPEVAASASEHNSAIASLLNKPAGPPLKKFKAPAAADRTTRSAPAPLPNAPAIADAASEKNSSVAALLNKPGGPVRQFKAPVQAHGVSGAGESAPLPNAPAIAEGGGEKDSEVAALLNKPSGPVRQFKAPPARGASGPAGAPADLPNAPAVGSTPAGQNQAISALFNKPGGPPPKPFTAPAGTSNTAGFAATSALPAPPSVSGGSTASATVAILGLNPADVAQIPRPEGSRPARIEAGTPVPGATRAELGGGNSSISVPDISIDGRPAASPATATRAPLDRALLDGAKPPATGLAQPQAPKILTTTPHVSAPQWPGSRSLPVAVENHFRNRVVYITLLPAAQSGDDWVVWYAEATSAPTDPNLVMHPPALMKAGSLPPVPAHDDHGAGSIRLTGVIGKDGHFGALTDLAGAPADRELAEALQSWQFGPARRNGVIVEADTVIEIPVVFGRLSLR